MPTVTPVISSSPSTTSDTEKREIVDGILEIIQASNPEASVLISYGLSDRKHITGRYRAGTQVFEYKINGEFITDKPISQARSDSYLRGYYSGFDPALSSKSSAYLYGWLERFDGIGSNKPKCTPSKSRLCGGACVPLRNKDGSDRNCQFDLPAKIKQKFQAVVQKIENRINRKGIESAKSLALGKEVSPQMQAAELDKKWRKTGVDKATLEAIAPIARRRANGERLSRDEQKRLDAVLSQVEVNKSKAFTEDGRELRLHPLKGQELGGNRVISRTELDVLGLTDANILDADNIDAVSAIRNGFGSFDDFLATPPVVKTDNYDAQPFYNSDIRVESQLVDRRVTIYTGDRVAMSVGRDGAVEFSVDGAFSLNDRPDDEGPPIAELKAMTKAFNLYMKSPASQRILYTTPTTDDDRGNTRVKLYEKRGFKITQGDRTGEKGRKVVMVLDNRGKDARRD